MGMIDINKIPAKFRGKKVIFTGSPELITRAINELGRHYTFVKEFRLDSDGHYSHADEMGWYNREYPLRNQYEFHDIHSWFVDECVEEYI